MTKAKTHKVDPEIIKARNRARSYFRREAKEYEERSVREAREALVRASIRQNKDRTTATTGGTVVRWVSEQSRAVFASLNITPKMEVSVIDYANAPTAKASTDFSRINVTVNVNHYDEHKPESIARLIALTKGLIYHEGGHILYTIPPVTLIEQAGIQGAPLSWDRLTGLRGPNPEITFSHFRWAWNLLEDQRMECAVVRMSPIIERYLQVVVMDVVVKATQGNEWRAWPFVTGRSYLPKRILDQFRAEAVKHAQENDKVDTLREIDRLVRAYKRAKTEREMAETAYEAVGHLRAWLGDMSNDGSVDDHGNRARQDGIPKPSDSATDSDPWDEPTTEKSSRPRKDKGSEQPTPSSSQDEDGDTGDTGDTQDNESGSDGFGDADNEASDDITSDDSDGNGDESDGSSSGTTDTTDTTPEDDDPQSASGSSLGGEQATHADNQEGLDDTDGDSLDEIINDLVSPDQINDLVSRVNESINRGLPYDPTIQDMDENLLALAYEVRAGMLDTLEPLAVQADPSWRFRQENGVLDPTAYVNREPGESDFWVGLDDSGATGHDLAVSVVLDVSYSMSSHVDALSVGALGIRLACDDLGIPCTLSTFASEGNLWMDATDTTTLTRVDAHGGTEPMEALEDLPNQRLGKGRHLVVVFTDGEWSGVPSFDQFREPGMFIIGTGFGSGIAGCIGKRNPDVAVSLDSVSQLPTEVTKALIGYLI